MLKRFCITFLPVLLTALLTISGCAVNPVTGKKEIAFVSIEKEIEIGEEHYLSSQQASGGLYTVDTALSEYVSSVGRRVAAVSDRALPYEFVVLNSSTPNAWALPGGKIAVHRGLLTELENEAELAAVLGHEIVHAAARHGAQAMQRGTLFGLILLGAQYAGKTSKHADYIVGAAGMALGLANQKYGRDAERTSDYYGMKYMRAAGYDSQTAVTLQEKFVALSKGRKSSWLDGLFASHPPSAERISNNRAALADFPTGGEVGRERYQRALAHLRAHRDAYEQADRARASMDSDPATALQTINRAIRREPREPLFYGIKGHILCRQERFREAVYQYNAAIIRDPGYYEYFLGRGIARRNLKQRAQARVDLERSNTLLPTALTSLHLGEIMLADGDRDRAKRFFEEASRAKGEVGDQARKAYVKLDIADAPQRYISAQPFFNGRTLILEVKNATPYAIGNVVIRVESIINTGEPAQHRVSLAWLAANATQSISGGRRYREQDAVKVKIRVLQAEIMR